MTLSPEDLNTIEKYALQNAVKYGKAPQPKAVMGKVMGECPHLRNDSKAISSALAEIVGEIAKGDAEAWETRLSEIAPELIEALSVKKEPVKGLKPLEGAVEGKVVMRFAPNPNGPATLGSSRGMVVNSEYVKMYKGKFILRFDDTDPDKKRPMLEAYDWYLDDFKWLGVVPDRVVYASDRFPVYYDYAKKLIEMGKAYVCFCEGGDFKKFKDSKQPCPHRDQSPEVNLAYWEKMLAGGYEDQQAVLRIKTDIEHKDPALRDWGAFRIRKMSHPRAEIGEKYIVWPLLDFAGAIEDHELGMTHIIRGKDLMDSEKRQGYIYGYLGWEYPKTLHWGRVKIHEFGKFSTSTLRKDIEAGIYSGWDDPRLPTIRAIRRRGIRAEALRKFMVEMGIGTTDVSISMESLYAENRKIVDPEANRYFFVRDPVELEIEGAEATVAKPPLHPTDSERGARDINVENKVLLAGDDVEKMEVGSMLRLKDLYNVEVTSLEPLQGKFAGESLEALKKVKGRIIHWAPVDGIPVKVRGPDGDFKGIGERGIAKELDKIVQFERFGFCRIDAVSEEAIVAYFSHK
ncbi:Glutamyl-tRNA synthetase / Glutamyl-tRNA(Gln) synthetase [Methanosarcina sp. MTP4]|uniref:glutamate--tRNA ligase n=1 Tax=Methanosarcina sp. MTP4 TaxID=1434100 RepID=UPI000615DDC9|nr:glutamate--tRNA ligase [Methanosarcina sp. MTP4]AKB26347.1 Glutamyl-tRNA synthetase / Glutamyl-tRNA(Gln) synthetase [Methanosarcina sp. MTP4]